MRFFWPNQLNPSPSGFTRFGRVLHWIATAIFLLLFVPGAFALAVGAQQYATSAGYQYGDYYTYYWPSTVTAGAAGTIVGTLVYFAGRALRYIFSGE